MIRGAALAALCLMVGGREAAADEPAVDVADLPPLPVVDDAAPSSSATVLAAASAEEDVVVAAAKREQSLGNVASAVTVISADRIRRFGYRTVGEAIAGVAGAYLVDNRLSYSIGIRGLQIPGDFNSRLLVLIDGASVNEAWGAFAGLGYDGLVSIDEVARIEVIRGPVSSIYGTNAFFGTINIVTRGAAETPGAWATTGVNSVDGATVNAGFAAGDVRRQIRGAIHLIDRIGDTTTLDEIPGKTGTRLTGDGSYALGGALAGSYGGSFAQIRAYRYVRQSPFAPYDVDPFGKPYEQHNTQLLIEGGHTRTVSDRLTVAGRIYGNFYEFSDSSPPVSSPPINSPPYDTIGIAQTVGAELRGRYELIPQKLGLTAGTEVSDNRTFSRAFEEDQPDVKLVDVPYEYLIEGTYAELDAQPTPWLGLTGGVRYDLHHDADTGLRSNFSPRVALFLAEPERYGLKLLFADGFRSASAFESHFDDGRDFIANPGINPERIRSFEAVAWAKPLPGLSLRVSGFDWTVTDVIQQRQFRDTEELQFQNVGRYNAQGAEAEASYRDVSGWYAYAGAGFARVHSNEQFGDDNVAPFTAAQAPNAPEITASGGLSTPKLFGRVHVSSELAFIDARSTRPDNAGVASPTSPAWLGWNAALYAPAVAGFDITAGVRNLLGKRDLLPAPGDYDRTVPSSVGTPTQIVVPRVPGEAREFYVKVGYAY